MKVYLNRIDGISDAIVSMYMSKRTWTRELEEDIRDTCYRVLDAKGFIRKDASENDLARFEDWMGKITKMGVRHITILKYVDFSLTVEGLHRGGQDDWDAHAERYNNRIIRNSTRLATFGNEKSDYYKDKILTTDEVLERMGIALPDEVNVDGVAYHRRVNGYIKEGYQDNKDVMRGLYMLSIPSNFTFKVNLTEWSHVYKERNKEGTANPEVKECCEHIADLLEQAHKEFNRELFSKIKN